MYDKEHIIVVMCLVVVSTIFIQIGRANYKNQKNIIASRRLLPILL